MKKIIIEKNDFDQRLDKFLTKAMPNLPVSLLYKFIRKKRVKLNGKKCEISTKLSIGDVLELYINDEFFEKNKDADDFKKVSNNLNIVYEDENIVLINKPVGMLVHMDKSKKIDCLVNRLKKYLFLKGEYSPEKESSFVPSFANRIDRNTSGIVIAAKNAESLRILNEKIKNREVKKSYLCIVLGNFEVKEQTLTAFLEKNSDENMVYISSRKKNLQNEKMIKTRYKVILELEGLSLLEVELITGRTHQIRAHMAFLEHPLLGDGKYGTNQINKKYKLRHQALCSYKLKFEFKSNGGNLNYLNGKEFEIPKENIWFLSWAKFAGNEK